MMGARNCLVEQRSSKDLTGTIDKNLVTCKETFFTGARFDREHCLVGSNIVLLRMLRARSNSRALLGGALYFQHRDPYRNRDTPCAYGRRSKDH